MERLLFKSWLLNEWADFGFDNGRSGKPKGGTVAIVGDTPFKVVNSSKIMTELYRLPPIGPNRPMRRWNDMVEYGDGPGAFQISVTPLGSIRVVARRLTKDLQGEATWITKHVFPICDNKDEEKEITIAHNIHGVIEEMSGEMIDAPSATFDNLEKLAWRLWEAAKKDHPSYCMFPVGMRKQNDDYYKLVFEFRGHGVAKQSPRGTGRTEQFNIDLLYDRKKGLIRCWGYDIESSSSQHVWAVQPSEWDEWFAPGQDIEQIIESVIVIFMQY